MSGSMGKRVARLDDNIAELQSDIDLTRKRLRMSPGEGDELRDRGPRKREVKDSYAGGGKMAKGFMPPGFGAGKGGFGGGKSMPPGGDITPGGGSSGKGGAKKGMPNFKARISKPGGLACGGKVKMARGGSVASSADTRVSGGKDMEEAVGRTRREGYAKGGALGVKAGQGSGVGRLMRSK